MLEFYLSMVDTDEERDLVTRLYTAYEKMMYNIALGILKNRQDAEDAVSDGFVRVINNLDKIEDVESIRTKGFMITIVKSTSINIYNKRKRDDHINIDDVYDISNEDIENDYLKKCDSDTVHKAIDKLNDNYKSVLRLKYFYEMNTGEIADVLDISADGVRKRLNRAEQSLMSVLLEEDI